MQRMLSIGGDSGKVGDGKRAVMIRCAGIAYRASGFAGENVLTYLF